MEIALRIIILILLRYHSFSHAKKKILKPIKPSSIINDEFADDGEFKFIVALVNKNDHMLNGAGSILGENWILTARHVVINLWIDDETYYFNVSSVFPIDVYPKYDNNLLHYENKPAFNVEEAYCHPFSNDNPISPWASDLALLKLSQPIPLNGADGAPYRFEKIGINDIQLDTSYIHDIRIAGWGRFNSMSHDMSTRLRKAILPTMLNEECVMHNLEYQPFHQICIYRSDQSFCNGDSGGPGLWKNYHEPNELLAGVISYTQGTDCMGYGALIDVGAYYKWIKYVMTALSRIIEHLRCRHLANKEFNIE